MVSANDSFFCLNWFEKSVLIKFYLLLHSKIVVLLALFA